MPASEQSLIETLETAFRSANPDRRLAVLDHVTGLFVAGADRYSDLQIALFDDVFLKLSANIEVKARRKLAHCLAPLARAPHKIVQRLACDPAAAVAAPVLGQSLQLEDCDLMMVASSASEDHLYALAQRKTLNEAITDVLIDRGGSRVACRVANNIGARLSDAAFGKLVKQASGDETLAQAVGTRRDIPRHYFLKLVHSASAAVRIKLAATNPDFAREIDVAVAETFGALSREAGLVAHAADAEAEIHCLSRRDRSGDVDTKALAQARKLDQTAGALSLLCHVPVDVAERALTDTKPDTLLILAKAAGCSWKTTKALLLIQAGDRHLCVEDLQRAREDFGRLQATTASDVIEHYRRRQPGTPETARNDADDQTPAPAA